MHGSSFVRVGNVNYISCCLLSVCSPSIVIILDVLLYVSEDMVRVFDERACSS
jgi:hypothetical protein